MVKEQLIWCETSLCELSSGGDQTLTELVLSSFREKGGDKFLKVSRMVRVRAI